ncbi:MAG: hypothetical protein ACRC6M_06990 [Microcystaceae cyanobacterium]
MKTTDKPLYNFLSIGSRGVGKSVFLAACYLECHRDRSSERLLWFDCEDKEVRQTIDNLLMYVAKTGEYPPATLKITNFEFLLRQRSQWGNQTLGQVRWWDVPGESCHIQNPAFTALLPHSDACCLFLDAPTLVEIAGDRLSLNRFLQPLESIVELSVNESLNIPFALILTKCDQLPPHSLYWQRLKQALHPFVTHLQQWQTDYQIFYSEIPVVEIDGVKTLQLSRVGTPIYWLFSQIHQLRQEANQITEETEINLDVEDAYYIPTPPPRWLNFLVAGKLSSLRFNELPKHEVLLVLLVLMSIATISTEIALQQGLLTLPKNTQPTDYRKP